MATFVVTRVRGQAWDTSRGMREQDDWDAHAAFMDALAEEGAIVLGGPLGEGERRFVHVFEAESREAIEARLAADPWTPARLLETESVEPWQVLLRRPDGLRP